MLHPIPHPALILYVEISTLGRIRDEPYRILVSVLYTIPRYTVPTHDAIQGNKIKREKIFVGQIPSKPYRLDISCIPYPVTTCASAVLQNTVKSLQQGKVVRVSSYRIGVSYIPHPII